MKENRYTMPQQFMDDANVALKWKLYGYLNGFWIGGKTVYARNDTIAKEFGKSERAVQEALAELEKIGLISRDIKGLSRYILPGGLKEEGRSPASPIYEAQLHPRDEAQLHHTSDRGIADINSYASKDATLPRMIVELSDLDGELGDSKSPRISPDKKKAYDELIAWSENERGFPFPKTTKTKQYRAFKLANQNEISRDRLIEMWEEMSTDKFWQKVGYDWMNVVQECLKKPV